MKPADNGGAACVRPGIERRHDVEDGEARDGVGVIEGEAVADAGAAIVTGDGETVVPEHPHQSDEVSRHGALGVGDVGHIG